MNLNAKQIFFSQNKNVLVLISNKKHGNLLIYGSLIVTKSRVDYIFRNVEQIFLPALWNHVVLRMDEVDKVIDYCLQHCHFIPLFSKRVVARRRLGKDSTNLHACVLGAIKTFRVHKIIQTSIISTNFRTCTVQYFCCIS